MTTEEEFRLQAENLDLRRLLQQAGVNAAERQTVEHLQSLLVGELHHRIKNILATVNGDHLPVASFSGDHRRRTPGYRTPARCPWSCA